MTHVNGLRIYRFDVQLFARVIDQWESLFSASVWRREIRWRRRGPNLVQGVQ